MLKSYGTMLNFSADALKMVQQDKMNYPVFCTPEVKTASSSESVNYRL